MACEGSSGVEKTFNMRTTPLNGSCQTQSVKVPPVSTATRKGGIGFLRRAGKLCDFTQRVCYRRGAKTAKISSLVPPHQVGGDKKKEHDGDDAVHGKKCRVQLAQVLGADQRVFVKKKQSD